MLEMCVRYRHCSLFAVASEPNVIKLFTFVIYGFRNKLVFVPGKGFQPSIMFGDKAGAYPIGLHLRSSVPGKAPDITHKH
jgi:hypothetical protein